MITMNILFWGLTFGLVGKILLAFGVIIAHANLAREHRIDRKVIRSFRIEFILTFVGILLIVFGYVMELSFFHEADLLSCDGPVCGAALDLILAN